MPVCNVVVSENYKDLSEKQTELIKNIVASGLDSKSRRLNGDHIALRVVFGKRNNMLADVEIEIFAQLYFRRVFSRDKRANIISEKISKCLKCSCATWINLQMVGYSRVTPNGNSFFSDSDNKLVSVIQKIRGISTKVKNS